MFKNIELVNPTTDAAISSAGSAVSSVGSWVSKLGKGVSTGASLGLVGLQWFALDKDSILSPHLWMNHSTDLGRKMIQAYFALTVVTLVLVLVSFFVATDALTKAS